MMAYWRGQDDEEQKQGGEPLRTGAPRGVASVLQSQLPTQQKQGSGFTNLQSWLDAGKGREKQIEQKTSRIAGDEMTELDKGTSTVTNSTFKPIADVSDDALTEQVMAGDMGFGKAATSQSYKGPRAISYDPSSRTGLGQLGLLQSAGGAAQVLGRQGATTGMRNLDTALFGADAASATARGGAKSTLGSLGFQTDDKQGTLSATGSGQYQAHKDLASKHISAQEAAAKAENDRWRGRYEGIGDKLLRGIDDRAQWANQLDDLERGRLQRLGHVFDPGSRATVGNMATQKELTGLTALRELLGLEKFGVAGGGKYVAPTSLGAPISRAAPIAEPMKQEPVRSEKSWQKLAEKKTGKKPGTPDEDEVEDFGEKRGRKIREV